MLFQVILFIFEVNDSILFYVSSFIDQLLNDVLFSFSLITDPMSVLIDYCNIHQFKKKLQANSLKLSYDFDQTLFGFFNFCHQPFYWIFFFISKLFNPKFLTQYQKFAHLLNSVPSFNHFYNFNNKYLLQIFILFFYFLESFNDLKKLLLCLFMNENLILIMSNILFEYF